jgi:HSP20 family protein
MTIYFSPNRRLAAIRESMNRLLEENMAEMPSVERELTLAVNVITEEDAYSIRALVPGLEADELTIEIMNNTVTLRGEFKNEVSENQRQLLNELPQGRFGRVITLPVAVDSTKVEASLKNGVLVLRIPKAEAHRPKTIKINMN